MNGLINGIVGGIVNGRVDTIWSLLNLKTILNDGETIAFFDSRDLTSFDINESNIVTQIRSLIGDVILNFGNGCGFSNGFTFDGVSQYLRSKVYSLSSQPIFLYFIIEQLSTTQYDCLCDSGAGGAVNSIMQGASAGMLSITANGGVTISTPVNLPVGKLGIIRVLFDGDNSSIQANETTKVVQNVGVGGLNGIRIGQAAGYYANFRLKAAIYRTSNSKESVIFSKLKSEFFDKCNIIGLTGQSNAIGYYSNSSFLPSGYEGFQDNIYIYFKELTGDEFDKMNPAVNCGYDWSDLENKTNEGFSVEQSAAHDLLTSTSKDVLVVKSGYNGGAIDEWDEGLAPFTELVDGFIRALDNADKNVFYTGVNKLSVLWMQGETDAINAVSTAIYEAKLRSVITRVRASDSMLSALQFIMCKLSDVMIGIANKININTAFNNIVLDTPNTLVLDTDSISGIAVLDGIHYTYDSILSIGSAWKLLM